jgi:thymidylate kinase
MLNLSEDPWPWKEPPHPISRGTFIVIEGLDRAGKTTQVKRLCDKLYSLGHNIKTIRFAGNSHLLLWEHELFNNRAYSSFLSFLSHK